MTGQDDLPLPRVRVTAQSALEREPGSEATTVDARSVYVRALMRSQLTLALYCIGAFIGLLVVFIVGLNYFPELERVTLVGVPLNWLLLGFGVYPLIVTTAMIYTRSARRNESAYRELLALEQASQ